MKGPRMDSHSRHVSEGKSAWGLLADKTELENTKKQHPSHIMKIHPVFQFDVFLCALHA